MQQDRKIAREIKTIAKESKACEKPHVTKWWHLLMYPDWLRRIQQKPARFLDSLVKPGMTAADIGCGLGFYTVELAKMVGENGLVLAVDMQPEMLKYTERKAKRAGLLKRIRLIQCDESDLHLDESLDFAMSMWVVHEVRSRPAFFGQIREALGPKGIYLLAEPILHVSRASYESICSDAEGAGLAKISQPKVGLSYATIFSVTDRSDSDFADGRKQS